MDLVVEILSPGTRKTEEITKPKPYEGFGVQEYWVVDLENVTYLEEFLFMTRPPW